MDTCGSLSCVDVDVFAMSRTRQSNHGRAVSSTLRPLYLFGSGGGGGGGVGRGGGRGSVLGELSGLFDFGEFILSGRAVWNPLAVFRLVCQNDGRLHPTEERITTFKQHHEEVLQTSQLQASLFCFFATWPTCFCLNSPKRGPKLEDTCIEGSNWSNPNRVPVHAGSHAPKTSMNHVCSILEPIC